MYVCVCMMYVYDVCMYMYWICVCVIVVCVCVCIYVLDMRMWMCSSSVYVYVLGSPVGGLEREEGRRRRRGGGGEGTAACIISVELFCPPVTERSLHSCCACGRTKALLVGTREREIKTVKRNKKCTSSLKYTLSRQANGALLVS